MSGNLSPADPAIQLAYQCLQERFEEMLAEEPKAWEGLDPEGVHQMRVATRRLRAAFRAFKDVLPAKPILAYNREFRRAAAVLGEVRDLDVYQDNLKHYAAEIPAGDAAHLNDYQQHLTEQRRNARKTVGGLPDEPALLPTERSLRPVPRAWSVAAGNERARRHYDLRRCAPTRGEALQPGAP